MRAYVLPLCLIGCATEIDAHLPKWAPGDLVETSGRRLKMVWWETDDGVRTLSRIHDTELGIDCTPLQVFSGRWLCGPTNTTSIVYAGAV